MVMFLCYLAAWLKKPLVGRQANTSKIGLHTCICKAFLEGKRKCAVQVRYAAWHAPLYGLTPKAKTSVLTHPLTLFLLPPNHRRYDTVVSASS